jgi:hypothetical protein
MKRTAIIGCGALLSLAALTFTIARGEDAPYQGSRFSEVWNTVKSDAYRTLPHQRVSVTSFFGWLENKLLNASKRTLSDRSDLLPRFQKLLHPNGICLTGTWRITEDTPYTGYFATGSEGLIIARASAALSEIKRGEARAFGLAGKIYPTVDPNHRTALKTANFFTIDDLGGTYVPYFLDAENTNDIINISIRPTGVFKGPLALAVANAFTTADGSTLDESLIRQLYPIAELGEAHPEQAVAPTWMKIVGAGQTPRVDEADFRDELAIENYPDGIAMDIYVADVGSRRGEKDWNYVGEILFTDSVASDSCDHRLHFSHPRFRRD